MPARLGGAHGLRSYGGACPGNSRAAPRFGDDKQTQWAEVFDPVKMDPGADLVLLHPDGREEVLVDCDRGSVAEGVAVKWERLRRQNHWFDALYTACAVGHYVGVRLVDENAIPVQLSIKVDLNHGSRAMHYYGSKDGQ